ncbi:hypothetical protein KM043_001941 [Ampulex compressa]|nr:hypothetical protein KM043_001941 [Ampulex compressa]
MSKNESGGESGGQGGEAPKKDTNADIYENRGTKKIVRLITVIAYLFSVSFVAIVLSAYYLFLWEPPNPRLIQRARLRADPQIQFLMGEPPRSRDTFANSPFNETEFDRKGFDRSYKSIMMRIAEEISPDDDFDDSQMEDRNKLNESLSILRNSLVEFLRREYNHSNVHRGNESRSEVSEDESIAGGRRFGIGKFSKSPSNFWEKSTAARKDSSAKEDRVIEKGVFVSRYENSTDAVYDSGPPLAPKSTTISGDEANKDGFTVEAGRTTRESLRNGDRTGYYLKGSTDVRRKTGNDAFLIDNIDKKAVKKDGIKRKAVIGKEDRRYFITNGSTAQIRTVTESTNRYAYGKEATKDKLTRSADQTLNERSVLKAVNKKNEIEEKPPDKKVRGSRVEKARDEVRPREIASPYTSRRYEKYSSKGDSLPSNGNAPSVDLPHSWPSTKRLEFPRATGGLVVASASGSVDPKETQIERMTTRSTAVTKEESPPPTISTQRTKDFLTILTETTSAGEVSPSLSPTSYENFRIDPSSTTEYRVENAS